MKKTSAALMALPLVASLLLAGCGGSAKPDPSSSNTTSSSPSSTTAPTAPTASATATATTKVSPKTDPHIPAAARAHTTAGAEAFVRYFIERWNVAWTSPRAGILSPLCQSASKACAGYEAEASRLSKEGHRYDRNPVTVKAIGALDSTGANHLGILANVVQERSNQIDGAGKTFVTDQRKDLRLHFQLLYIDKAWSVISIKLIK